MHVLLRRAERNTAFARIGVAGIARAERTTDADDGGIGDRRVVRRSSDLSPVLYHGSRSRRSPRRVDAPLGRPVRHRTRALVGVATIAERRSTRRDSAITPGADGGGPVIKRRT